MRFFFLVLFITTTLCATQSAKKKRFYAKLVHPVQDVYHELNTEYLKIKSDLEHAKTPPNLEALKKMYKVSTNQELLMALKPHPPSIVLAQAAMESAWGTSRFFKEANNVFGLWSTKNAKNKIAAQEKRKGKRTIWLKKFSTIKESVREYYKTLARAKAYKKFREYRYKSNDVFIIILGLDKYSEMGKAYVESLSSLIKYNKLQKYD